MLRIWKRFFCGDLSFFCSEKGQIAIPSLLILPSLFLVGVLLYETAKLSREKIRHQFALDTAAFVEMNNYTDFFNRTAYVNGAFPNRIFQEAYGCPPETNMIDRTYDAEPRCLADILYDAGAFPKGDADDDSSEWKIRFSNGRGADLNVEDPSFPSKLEMIPKEPVLTLKLPWEAANDVYTLYYTVYYNLGAIQSYQKTIFENLVENAYFFENGYQLNSGSPVYSVSPFPLTVSVKNHAIDKLYFAARQVDDSGWNLYRVVETGGGGVTLPGGLFQLATISADFEAMAKGLEVNQRWDIPDNFFNVDFGSGVVHARVAGQCPKMKTTNNCVWPNPTPKYQTRLYP
jgi:hypothetical protein